LLTLTTIAEARSQRHRERAAGRQVALVPTMGALHDGHLSLVRRARELAPSVWVSVFVNPTQFGPDEDFDSYPRNLDRDCQLLEQEGTDVVFAPTVAEIYPRPARVEIHFSGLETVLCGAHRPQHFAGVGLVVAKLFNIVEPQFAVFGQKDAQQALLIRRLVADLDFAVHIDVAPTKREADGLAMSSRNAYLSPDERRAAPAIYRALKRGHDAIVGGETDPQWVCDVMARTIGDEPVLRLEYAECVAEEDLATPETIDRPVLLAIAAHAGTTRLIDNMRVVPRVGGEG
jgi:pantoate--beta-alanine ligase